MISLNLRLGSRLLPDGAYHIVRYLLHRTVELIRDSAYHLRRESSADLILEWGVNFGAERDIVPVVVHRADL